MADHGRGPQLSAELVVERYSGVVRAIVRRMERFWPDLTLDRDDLHQSGMVGLLEAAQRFDPERGVPFIGFAWPRITGAIVDAVAEQTGIHRAQARQLRGQAYEETLAASTLRTRPIDHRAELVVDDNDTIYPDRRFALDEQHRLLSLGLSLLDDTERAVLAAGYLDGHSLSALARDHGVSRSSMSRARGRAIARLRCAIVELVEAHEAHRRPWRRSLAALRRDVEASTRRGGATPWAIPSALYRDAATPARDDHGPPADTRRDATRGDVPCPLPSEILILAAKKKTPSVRQRRPASDSTGEPAARGARPAPSLSTEEVGHEHGVGIGCGVGIGIGRGGEGDGGGRAADTPARRVRDRN